MGSIFGIGLVAGHGRRSRPRRGSRLSPTARRLRPRAAAATLCVGSERDGLPPEVVAACEASWTIPLRDGRRRVAQRRGCGGDRAAADIVGRRRGWRFLMMLDQVAKLRADAEAAIAAAGRRRRARGAARAAAGPQVGADRRSCAGSASCRPDERGPVGAAANEARQAIEAALEARVVPTSRAARMEARLAEDAIDVTLPGIAPVAPGHLHLITQTRREIEDVFVGLGYRVLEGPEIEHDYYNFTALNHPPGHPARMIQDTFYVDPATLPEGVVNEQGLPPGPRDVVLRTHTSPMQIRAMEAQEPPIFVVVPGTVYRRDSDATHTPMFSQVEGLAVGRGHLARRPRRHARGGGAGAVRARAPHAPEARLLPLHRAERPGRRLLLRLRRLRRAGRRLARLALQGDGVDRDPRRRDGRPERVRLRARARATTPRPPRASPSAWASSASRC